MADIASMNGVAAASIAEINGVAKAAIAKLGGVDMPASGATLWCLVAADGGLATAAHSDLNDWTGYVNSGLSGRSKDFNEIAYGKDGSGNPLWVAVAEYDSARQHEIWYSSDPTNTSGWTAGTDPGAGMGGIAWGNNVWVAVGGSGMIYRSTDGASWTDITSDLDGDVSEWTNSVGLQDVASDGAGNWICTQADRVYYSSDNGVTWELGEDWNDGYTAYSCGYTNSKWVVFRGKTGHTRIVTSSNGTTWATAVQTGDASKGIGNEARNFAAGAGTIIIVAGDDISRSTDTGANFTKTTNTLNRSGSRHIATDGNGTWVVVYDSGRVDINTNNGAPGSWVEQTGGQLTFPSSGANVENLDAVAADVYLPV